MKTKLLTYLFLFTIILTGCNKSENTYLNDVRFHDTLDEVKSKILNPINKEDADKLIYEDNLFGYEVKIMYVFSNDELKDIFVNFTETYNSDDEYELRFYKIKEALVNKCGKRDLAEIQKNSSIWNLNEGKEEYKVLLNMDEENVTTILYTID